MRILSLPFTSFTSMYDDAVGTTGGRTDDGLGVMSSCAAMLSLCYANMLCVKWLGCAGWACCLSRYLGR